MLKDAITLLSQFGLVDGNTLPDSTPGTQYQFRSCSPNLIVPAPGMKTVISGLLKDHGYTVKAMGTMLQLSK
jgi:hypothetical protein